MPVPSPSAASAKPARRRLVYGFLAILFGFCGLHNYYARHWLTGVLQLLLSIATLLLGFGVIAAWLWAIVEAIAVRKDGQGMDMI
jgi:TM2 domain-containing membrane protein YozV